MQYKYHLPWTGIFPEECRPSRPRLFSLATSYDLMYSVLMTTAETLSFKQTDEKVDIL